MGERGWRREEGGGGGGREKDLSGASGECVGLITKFKTLEKVF